MEMSLEKEMVESAETRLPVRAMTPECGHEGIHTAFGTHGCNAVSIQFAHSYTHRLL